MVGVSPTHHNECHITAQVTTTEHVTIEHVTTISPPSVDEKNLKQIRRRWPHQAVPRVTHRPR